MNKTKSVVAHRVLVTDDDGLYEINYSYLCPHCGKEHTQREADGHDPLMNMVCYSLRCGDVRIIMPWHKGRTAVSR